MTSKYEQCNSSTQVYNQLMSESIDVPRKPTIRKTNPLLMTLAWEFNFLNVEVTYSKENPPIILYIGESLKPEYVESTVYDIDAISTTKELVNNKGKNIEILARCYSSFKFYAYDTNDVEYCSSAALYAKKEDSNLKLFKRMPTDTELERFSKKKNVYLICNITDQSVRDEPDFEKEAMKELEESNLTKEEFYKEKMRLIYELNKKFHELKESVNIKDLDEQQRIATIVMPVSSLFKFRPNHTLVNEYSFFSGKILLPIFSKYKSAECRIVVTRDEIEIQTLWNFHILYKKINYWNDVTREKKGLNPFSGTALQFGQFGNGMEVLTLVSIFKDFFTKIGISDITQEEMLKFYADMLSDEPENSFC